MPNAKRSLPSSGNEDDQEHVSSATESMNPQKRRCNSNRVPAVNPIQHHNVMEEENSTNNNDNNGKKKKAKTKTKTKTKAKAKAKAKVMDDVDEDGWGTETIVSDDDGNGLKIKFGSGKGSEWLDKQYASNWSEFFPSMSEMPAGWPGPDIPTGNFEGLEQISANLEAFSPMYWLSSNYTGRRNKNGYLDDNLGSTDNEE
ncbi:hypothetical protein BDN70DRAFT_939918 [Pholiota conissans]|uniref:Uncharacterized protein n=1 Tax=Pholiota conissans TaxID=109636 RepID=A0A9P5YK31_9AGAR|nr:hypothetical protein BDN70DRAFT_939918 [Pholiota conissans]